MKVKTIVLSALFLGSIVSHALEIQSAQIDAKRKVMVLTVRTDCNLYYPSLKYDFSHKRVDGPHYYSLTFSSTKMNCNTRRFYIRNIEVPLPEQHNYQTVSIRYEDLNLRYNTSNGLQNQDIELAPPRKSWQASDSSTEATR